MKDDDEINFLYLYRNHPWVRRRSEMMGHLIERFACPRAKRCLEIGCGPGNNLAYLSDRFPAIGFEGIDLQEQAVKISKQRNLDAYQDDALKFRHTTRYDVIIMGDLLEHLTEPHIALDNANAHLADKGILVCTVPANPSLYGEHDKKIGHLRRYSKESLMDLAHGCRLHPRFVGYWNGVLYPIVAPVRKIISNPKQHDFEQGGRVGYIIMDHALGMENRLIRRGHALPFGLSIVAVFEKESTGIAAKVVRKP